MAGKMKKFNIRGMLDGLRQSVSSTSPKSETEIEETLRSEDLQVCKTVRHGFPYQPTAIAFDPVQHILAIGTKTGSLRIFGQAGVDLHCHHGADVAVLQILFLVNEGALVTCCSDDNLHLWNFRQKRPQIVQSLKFQRERITYSHLAFQSKWLYVGTDKGNVHIVNIESFILSGYVIMWNKAIELSRKTHPGAVLHLSDNPLDPSKLLIGFECGAIVMWDLRNKTAECRHQAPESLRSISWHHEGKQFMSSHTDGSLVSWIVKSPGKPASIITPHAKVGKDGKPDPCKPITKVEWKSVRNNDPLVIFSGGMSCDRAGRTPCITVMTGKTTTVLEMEHTVIDFVVLCETPWQNDFQDPYAIVVLLQNDLVVIDLTSPGYPCFENPYPMDIHESPVTACQYFADCQTDLIPALYSVGSSKHKRTGFSEKRWPIKGGVWGSSTCSYPEIVVTGHADGSVKFWDASAVTLQVLYKLKTAKMFEKPKNRVLEGQEDDPFAIYMMYLDQESRLLVLAGATHIMLFKFSKQEVTYEVTWLDVSIVYEVFDDLDSPDLDFPKPSLAVMGQHQQSGGSMGSYSSNASDSGKQSKPSLSLMAQQQKSGGSMGSYSSDCARSEPLTALKVRGGARKWSPGYQCDLVGLLTWNDNEHPGNITSICVNSNYGLLAFGNESGLAIVDIIQKTCLLNLGTPDLYGFKDSNYHHNHHHHHHTRSMDPYQRAPRSPRGKKPQPSPLDGSNSALNEDGARSPTSDQPVTPDNIQSNPKAPPRKKRPNQNLKSINEGDQLSSKSKEPQSAPIRSNSFEFGIAGSETEVKLPEGSGNGVSTPAVVKAEQDQTVIPGLNLIPPTPQVSQKNTESPDKSREGFETLQPTRLVQKNSPKKLSAVRTSSLPLVPIPGKEQIGENISSKSKSQSEEDFKASLTEPCLADGKNFKIRTVNIDTESLEKPQHHGRKYSMKKFKKKLRIGGKHRDKSSERISKTVDPNDNDITAESEEMSHDEFASHESRSENEDNILTDDEFLSPNQNMSDEAVFHSATKKDGFLRRMSVKMQQLVSRSGSDNCQPEFDRRGRRCVSFLDLMDDSESNHGVISKKTLREMITVPHHDKNDGSSFSRSRSSSISSLENVSKEAIQCLVFADSYTRKLDTFTSPCLWVGTSLGSVLVIVLNLPPPGESRLTQPVIVSPSGTIFRLKGALQCMSFLDTNGMIIPTLTSGAWRETGKDEAKSVKNQSVTKLKMSPSTSTEVSDRQFAIICSEKQARVVSLPSQTCPYKARITENSFVVKADVVNLRGDSVCLACYVANGHIMVYSLPSLKLLLDMDFLPLSDLRVARTFCFSNNGHALYMCSPTELQKVTYSAEICDNLNEMLGELFVPTETPEAPKQGFFKNLFGGGTSTLDREELFGESSGKAARGLVSRTHGTGGIQSLQAQSQAAVGGEVSRARLLLSERGEKLSGVADRTEEMALNAEAYASTAHQLMLKYKEKKWYQF
ncbi:syntaxin-binding protein 5-like isoform X2 [Dreissena polymorpha]|uniref:syntaxin-binding protein 5-like isoform X2 n=1 Tax=Dreissena polymorpha TaxID=45954 RepID=UPI002264A5A4|nr:syntaxin-binding protein 5-like isoform X2 [Dreissena polymorpha]